MIFLQFMTLGKEPEATRTHEPAIVADTADETPVAIRKQFSATATKAVANLSECNRFEELKISTILLKGIFNDAANTYLKDELVKLTIQACFIQDLEQSVEPALPYHGVSDLLLALHTRLSKICNSAGPNRQILEQCNNFFGKVLEEISRKFTPYYRSAPQIKAESTKLMQEVKKALNDDSWFALLLPHFFDERMAVQAYVHPIAVEIARLPVGQQRNLLQTELGKLSIMIREGFKDAPRIESSTATTTATVATAQVPTTQEQVMLSSIEQAITKAELDELFETAIQNSGLQDNEKEIFRGDLKECTEAVPTEKITYAQISLIIRKIFRSFQRSYLITAINLDKQVCAMIAESLGQSILDVMSRRFPRHYRDITPLVADIQRIKHEIWEAADQSKVTRMFTHRIWCDGELALDLYVRGPREELEHIINVGTRESIASQIDALEAKIFELFSDASPIGYMSPSPVVELQLPQPTVTKEEMLDWTLEVTSTRVQWNCLKEILDEVLESYPEHVITSDQISSLCLKVYHLAQVFGERVPADQGSPHEVTTMDVAVFLGDQLELFMGKIQERFPMIYKDVTQLRVQARSLMNRIEEECYRKYKMIYPLHFQWGTIPPYADITLARQALGGTVLEYLNQCFPCTDSTENEFNEEILALFRNIDGAFGLSLPANVNQAKITTPEQLPATPTMTREKYCQALDRAVQEIGDDIAQLRTETPVPLHDELTVQGKRFQACDVVTKLQELVNCWKEDLPASITMDHFLQGPEAALLHAIVSELGEIGKQAIADDGRTIVQHSWSSLALKQAKVVCIMGNHLDSIQTALGLCRIFRSDLLSVYHISSAVQEARDNLERALLRAGRRATKDINGDQRLINEFVAFCNTIREVFPQQLSAGSAKLLQLCIKHAVRRLCNSIKRKSDCDRFYRILTLEQSVTTMLENVDWFTADKGTILELPALPEAPATDTPRRDHTEPQQPAPPATTDLVKTYRPSEGFAEALERSDGLRIDALIPQVTTDLTEGAWEDVQNLTLTSDRQQVFNALTAFSRDLQIACRETWRGLQGVEVIHEQKDWQQFVRAVAYYRSSVTINQNPHLEHWLYSWLEQQIPAVFRAIEQSVLHGSHEPGAIATTATEIVVPAISDSVTISPAVVEPAEAAISSGTASLTDIHERAEPSTAPSVTASEEEQEVRQVPLSPFAQVVAVEIDNPTPQQVGEAMVRAIVASCGERIGTLMHAWAATCDDPIALGNALDAAEEKIGATLTTIMPSVVTTVDAPPDDRQVAALCAAIEEIDVSDLALTEEQKRKVQEAIRAAVTEVMQADEDRALELVIAEADEQEVTRASSSEAPAATKHVTAAASSTSAPRRKRHTDTGQRITTQRSAARARQGVEQATQDASTIALRIQWIQDEARRLEQAAKSPGPTQEAAQEGLRQFLELLDILAGLLPRTP